MHRALVLPLCLCLVLPVAGLAHALTPDDAKKAIAGIDAGQVKKLIERLCDDALQGRRAGTESIKEAAGRVKEALGAAGVTAEIVTAGEHVHVIGTIVGKEKPEEAVLVSAHFDGPGEIQGKLCPAADESASGVAALVEVARGLASARVSPSRTVVLAAFSGYWHEEDTKRFLGSKAWVQSQKRKLILHVDVGMVGVGLFPKEPGRLFAIGGESGEGVNAVLKAAAEAEADLKVTRTSGYLIDGQGPRDDYAALRSLEVPYVYVTNGVSKHYHKPGDVPQQIDTTRVANAARYALRVVAGADALDAPPAFKKTLETDDMHDAREVLGLVEAALDPASGLEMSKSAREAMIWKRDKVKDMIERGKLEKKDRAYLQRTLESLLYVLIG